jgi:hypothetical protein
MDSGWTALVDGQPSSAVNSLALLDLFRLWRPELIPDGRNILHNKSKVMKPLVSPTAKEPNVLMNRAYIGALFLATAVLGLGVGLIRAERSIER